MTPTLDDFATHVRLPPGTELDDTTQAGLREVTRLAREMRHLPDTLAMQARYSILAALVLGCAGFRPEVGADVAAQVWLAVRAEHHA